MKQTYFYIKLVLCSLTALALMVGMCIMTTSCEMDKPEPMPIEQTDSLSTSPVMLKMQDMIATLGLVAMSESDGKSNTIKSAKYFDSYLHGTEFATLNEKESTKNKLVYDMVFTTDSDESSYYRQVFEINDGDITKTRYYKSGDVSKKPNEKTVWEKRYTHKLIKEGNSIAEYSDDGTFECSYSPNSYNSVIQDFRSGAESLLKDIKIVTK